MFTPQKRAQPSWVMGSNEKRDKKDKGKVDSPDVRFSGASDVSVSVVEKTTVELSVVDAAPPLASLDTKGMEVGHSEPEIWKSFIDAGTLDVESLEKKDRAALQDRIQTLSGELYDYQYNMGLLLMERKNWGTKSDELKAVIVEAQENLQREQAAHLIALEEAEKREEVLKRALEIEKECVCDLEKALKEMQTEAREIKESTEKQLAEAKELRAAIEEKTLRADAKVYEAQAINAEANRKYAESDRKLQEVEAREDALRRERQRLHSDVEAQKVEVEREEHSLRDWEKRLEEGRDRLHDGERLLNTREEFINKHDQDLKRIEKDLQESRNLLEKERSILTQLEADVNVRVAELTEQEQTSLEREISIDKKEQEMLLLQEKLAARERAFELHELLVKDTEALVLKDKDRLEALEGTLKLREEALGEQKEELVRLQNALSNQSMDLVLKKKEAEEAVLELEKQRSMLDAEKEKNREKLLNDLKNERVEIDIEKKRAQQEIEAEKEKLRKEMEVNKQILENERVKLLNDLLVEREGIEKEKQMLKQEIQLDRKKFLEEVDVEKQVLKCEREQIQHERARLLEDEEAEKLTLQAEREKLSVIEQERKELLQVQTQLKTEIDDIRARKQLVSHEVEELKREKERFELEWDLVDEKKEELRKHKQKFEEESKRMTEWLKSEEARLQVEKQEIQSQSLTNSESLSEEREAFLKRMERERLELFTKVEKEREDLIANMELQRMELEQAVEKDKDELHKLAHERESKWRLEVEREREKLREANEAVSREAEQVKVERQKLDKERLEILKQRDDAENEWLEIKKDITELQIQREKLKEQREALHKEREEILREKENVVLEASRLKKMKIELKEAEDSLQFSEHQQSHRDGQHVHEAEVLSPDRGLSDIRESEKDKTPVQQKPTNGAEASPGTLRSSPSGFQWLKSCLFGGNENTQTVQKEANDQVPRRRIQYNEVPHSELLKPSRSFNHSQLGQVVGLDKKQGKAKRLKRTTTIEAAIEEARLFLGEGSEAGCDEEAEGRDEILPADGNEVNEQGGKGKEENADTLIAEAADHKGVRAKRKRGRLPLSKDKILDQDMVDESDSEVGGGGRRKRRLKDIDVLSGVNGDSGLETPLSGAGTPGARRYNLRRSTIINSIATQAVSAASMEEKEAAGLHQDRSHRRKSQHSPIPEAPDPLEVSSPEPANVVEAVSMEETETIKSEVIVRVVELVGTYGIETEKPDLSHDDEEPYLKADEVEELEQEDDDLNDEIPEEYEAGVGEEGNVMDGEVADVDADDEEVENGEGELEEDEGMEEGDDEDQEEPDEEEEEKTTMGQRVWDFFIT